MYNTVFTHDNHMLIIILIIETFASFALIFVACELGGRVSLGVSLGVSLAFTEIDYMVGQFNSYNFPPNIKKMLPISRAMVQKPFWFSVFGSITCSRKSFKKVSPFVEVISNNVSIYNFEYLLLV